MSHTSVIAVNITATAAVRDFHSVHGFHNIDTARSTNELMHCIGADSCWGML